MSKRLSFSIAVNLLTENFKKGTNTVKNSLRSMQMQVLTFAAALGAGGLGLAGLLSRFREVARETSRVTTALKNVSIGVGGFAENVRFIYDLAKKYGLEVNALTSNFAKFTASAAQANMPMEDQKKIFESLSKASTAFALSSEQTDGVFLALTQMMGKGKISMEELRNQMGEKLPIAMSAMAKALGVSISEMDKLVSTGKVMSADVLPKFADALNNMIPDVDTNNLEASLNKLSNAFTKIVDESGFQNKYKALVDGLTSLLESASKNIQNIIVGLIAAIGFVVTNGLAKVYRSYASTGQQIIANEEITSRKMRASVQSYTEAKKRLSDLELQHAQANAQKQIALARRIEDAKLQVQSKAAAARRSIADRVSAHEAASHIKTAGKLGVVSSMFVGTTKKIGVALKSLWASFSPAIIVSAIIALIGYFKGLRDEANRVKKIFSDYKNEIKSFRPNTNEIIALQTQLKLINSKTKGTKEHEAAVSSVRKMLGLEKGDHRDLNKLVQERIKLLQTQARVDLLTRKQMEAEDTVSEIYSKHGGEDEFNAKYLKKSKEWNSTPDILKNLVGGQDILTDMTAAVASKKIIADTTKRIEELTNDLNIDTNNKETTTTTAATDPDNKALRAAEKRLEALRKLDEEDRKRQIEKQKFDLDLQQKAIDTMDDSFEKRTKQTLLNLKKENLAIEEYQNELQKKQEEHLKTKYVSVKGDDKGFEAYLSELRKSNFKDKKGADILPEGLRPEDISKQVGQLLGAAQKEQEKGLREINKDLSIMLKEQELMFTSDLTKKLADLDSFYDEQRIKAGNNATLITQIESNRKRAKTEATVEDKLNKLDFEEQLKQERIAGMESIGMTELVEEKKLEITRMYIQKRINALDVLASMGDQEAYKEMDMLKASLKKLDVQKPAKSLKSLADKAIFDAIKKGFEKAGDSAEEAEEKTIELFSKFSKHGASIAETVDLIQSAFGGLNEDLDIAMQMVGNIAQGFAQGGIPGGVIAIANEGLKILSTSSRVNKEHREALRLLKLQREQQQHLYNLANRQSSLEYKEGDTVFGSDKWGKASNASNEYAQSLKDLDASLSKLKDVDVVTGSRKSGWGPWRKRKDVWGNLLDAYPDLIKANGEFDKTLAETILTTQKLDEQGKQSLQNAIQNAEQLESAYTAMKDYLTGIFGDLGNTIMDTFIDAFKGGKDAMSNFYKSASDMLANLVKDFIYSMRLAPIIKKATDKAEQIMQDTGLTDEQRNQQLVEVTGSLIKDGLSAKNQIDKDLEYWGKEIEKQIGKNPFTDETSTQDSTKGYSVSMDQDTGGAILGRVTGLHESILTLTSMVSGITLNSSKSLTQFIVIGDELRKHTEIFHEMRDIQTKTLTINKEVKESLSILDNIKSDLTSINKNTKGLAPR